LIKNNILDIILYIDKDRGKNMLKIRKENGITLISLIVTIIILVIITYVSISMSINLTGTANFQNVHTYLLLIETKAEFLANKDAIGELGEEGYYGEKQESGDYAGWYKLSQGDLNDMGIKDAKASDGYYVNYEGNDVAYAKGVENDGQVFYKLSQIKAYSNE